MIEKIVIGSRASRLAMVQSEWVKQKLLNAFPGCTVTIDTVVTEGDRRLDRALADIGGKGLFTAELETKLRKGEIDLAVHSLKDVPQELPEDLPLLALTERETPFDALIVPKEVTQANKKIERIGTSSPRRILQCKALFPEAECVLMRGNVNTRLKKLNAGECEALILAAAGLKRLGLEDCILRILTCDEMVPAAGQGILAIQGRANDKNQWTSVLENQNARCCYVAESAFIRALSANCTSPVGAYAYIEGNMLQLEGVMEGIDEKPVRGRITEPVEYAERMGRRLAEQMIQEARR